MERKVMIFQFASRTRMLFVRFVIFFWHLKSPTTFSRLFWAIFFFLYNKNPKNVAWKFCQIRLAVESNDFSIWNRP
jgi:hypothetical protein